MKRKIINGIILGALALAPGMMAAPSADASGITVYKDGDKYVELGGRIQVQYHLEDEDGGDTTDSLAFRRLRPYIEGSIHRDWMGKFEWDMGEASEDNEIAIKDAYMAYKGLEGITIKFGNAYAPFSREALTSSKKQQLVERTFVGDHNYGSPDRSLGVHADGSLLDKNVTWAASVTSASIDPDNKKLDFDTPVNRNDDFNEGWMLSGRVDYHPFGYLDFSQGDFNRDTLKATVGVAAFTWNNDGDNNGFANSVEKVNGYELSGAVRYMGASVDAQYNIFDAEAVNTALTAGIFKNGSTQLTNYSVEGGYMVIPSKLEVVAGYSGQDADNYAKQWTRTELGANWFFQKHDIKLQGTYRMGKNVDGVDGADTDEVFIQAQYVF
ncbi:MAG: porin [Deltaproteobacteria bacterium]|nr:porin [Deltaproteobacteria bacterium]